MRFVVALPRTVKGLTAGLLASAVLVGGQVAPSFAEITTTAAPAAVSTTAAGRVAGLEAALTAARKAARSAAGTAAAKRAAAGSAAKANTDAQAALRRAATVTTTARKAVSRATRAKRTAAQVRLRRAVAAESAVRRTAAARSATARSAAAAAAAATSAARAAEAKVAGLDRQLRTAGGVAGVSPAQQELRDHAIASGRKVMEAMLARQAANPGTPLALWEGSTGSCQRCLAGPALAAASLAAATGDDFYLDIATRTFDDAIRRNFDPASGAMSRNDIETAFFGGALGLATLQLGDRLDPAHRARYTSVVAAGARFLRNNGNLGWYTNGNINLANAGPMLAAYQLTGDQQYYDMYKQALAFAISPNTPRWAGRGLVVTRRPAEADGSDGAAYFTEEGAKPGWDPEYGMLQLDMLMRLDLLGGGPEIKRLINMLYNQEATRIDTKGWRIDLSNGSRHPQPNRIWGLQTPVISYLAFHGRPDLQPLAMSAAKAVTGEVQSNLGWYAPGLEFAHGSIWSTMLG